MRKLLTLILLTLSVSAFGQLDIVKRNVTALDTVKALKDLRVRDTTIVNLIKHYGGGGGISDSIFGGVTIKNATDSIHITPTSLSADSANVTFANGDSPQFGGVWHQVNLGSASNADNSSGISVHSSVGSVQTVTMSAYNSSTDYATTKQTTVGLVQSGGDSSLWAGNDYFVTAPWVEDRMGGTTASATVHTATVTLTSAQLIANTSVQILPAQASGKMAVPLNVIFKYTFGTTAYTSNEFSASLYYGTTLSYSIATTSMAGFLTSTSDNTAVCSVVYTAAPSNLAMSVQNATASTSLGDGTLTVIITYTIIDI